MELLAVYFRPRHGNTIQSFLVALLGIATLARMLILGKRALIATPPFPSKNVSEDLLGKAHVPEKNFLDVGRDDVRALSP